MAKPVPRFALVWAVPYCASSVSLQRQRFTWSTCHINRIKEMICKQHCLPKECTDLQASTRLAGSSAADNPIFSGYTVSTCFNFLVWVRVQAGSRPTFFDILIHFGFVSCHYLGHSFMLAFAKERASPSMDPLAETRIRLVRRSKGSPAVLLWQLNFWDPTLVCYAYYLACFLVMHVTTLSYIYKFWIQGSKVLRAFWRSLARQRDEHH